MVENEPRVCNNCGATLNAQWWDNSAGGFRCQHCGTLMTVGAAIRRKEKLKRRALALLVLGAVLVAAAFVVAFIGELPCMDMSNEARMVQCSWAFTASYGLLALAVISVLSAAVVWLRSRRWR
jgi:hypothetical protein